MDIESALSQINSMLENEETNEKFKSFVDILSKSGIGEDSSGSEASTEKATAPVEEKPDKSSSDDTMGSLVSILSALGGSGGNSSPKPKSQKSEGGLGDIAGLLGQASKLFGSSKVTNEQRLAVLDAIEPFLKEERRTKVHTSKQILNIAGIAKLFDGLNL